MLNCYKNTITSHFYYDRFLVKPDNSMINEYYSFTYDAAGIILEALKKVGPDRKAIVNHIADPGFQYLVPVWI